MIDDRLRRSPGEARMANRWRLRKAILTHTLAGDHDRLHALEEQCRDVLARVPEPRFAFCRIAVIYRPTCRSDCFCLRGGPLSSTTQCLRAIFTDRKTGMAGTFTTVTTEHSETWLDMVRSLAEFRGNPLSRIRNKWRVFTNESGFKWTYNRLAVEVHRRLVYRRISGVYSTR